jgi:hypothetical protein
VTIAVVYGNDAGGTTTSTTVAISSTTSAGDGVGVWVKWGASTGTVSSVSDGTNTYTAVANTLCRNTDNGHSEQLFYCPNLPAGTRTITATFSVTQTNRDIAYARFTGADTAAAAQTGAANFQVSPGPGTGTDAVTSGNMTPTSQPGAVWGVSVNHIAASTINAGTGYTSLGTLTAYNGLQGDNSLNEWKRITSTSAVAATFTATSASEEFDTVAMIVSEATAAATGLVGQACL